MVRPVFDTCRVPLFLWNTYPYNYWETLTRSFAVLFSVYKEEWPVGGWVGGWVGDGGGAGGGVRGRVCSAEPYYEGMVLDTCWVSRFLPFP